MNKENFKIILIIVSTVVIFSALAVAFFVYKNLSHQSHEQTTEKILNAKETVNAYIQADMAGADLGFGPDNISQFFTYSNGLHTNFIFSEVHFSVIKKYEIIGESQPVDSNTHYIKVNFYCDKIISHEPVGLKSEKGIKASLVSGGEPTFFTEDCSEYFKAYCLTEKKQTNDNASYDIFNCNNNIETVNFELVKDGQAWKINGPGGGSHVSVDVFNKWLKE